MVNVGALPAPNTAPQLTRAQNRRDSEARIDLLMQLEALMSSNQDAAMGLAGGSSRPGGFAPPTALAGTMGGTHGAVAAATTVVAGADGALGPVTGLSQQRGSLRLNGRRGSQIDPLSLSSMGLGDLGLLNNSQRLQPMGDFGADDELRLSFYFSHMDVERGVNTLLPTTQAGGAAAAAAPALATAMPVAPRQAKPAAVSRLPEAALTAEPSTLMMSLDTAALRDGNTALLQQDGLRITAMPPVAIAAVNAGAAPGGARRGGVTAGGDDVDDSDQPMPSDWL